MLRAHYADVCQGTHLQAMFSALLHVLIVVRHVFEQEGGGIQALVKRFREGDSCILRGESAICKYVNVFPDPK